MEPGQGGGVRARDERDRRVLPMGTAGLVVGAVIGVVCVLVGVALLAAGSVAVGATVAALSAAMAVMFGYAVYRRPSLVLDRDGFAVVSPFQPSFSARWSDCGPFRTRSAPGAGARLAGQRYVTFGWQGQGKPARMLARGIGNDGCVLAANYGGLFANELADLLNRYRNGFGAAGGQARP